jgi:hypothetical protein
LILKDIEVNLPLLSFTGAQASFDFLYEISAHRICLLKGEAPDIAFVNGAYLWAERGWCDPYPKPSQWKNESENSKH